MNQDAWYDKLGGRKFVMGESAIILGFILSLMGKLDANFTIVLTTSLGFFAAANTLTTMASLKANPQPVTDQSNA